MSIQGLNLNKGIEKVGGIQNPSTSQNQKIDGGPSFKDTLNELTGGSQATVGSQKLENALKFSSHAVERMQTRGITFDPTQMQKIESAIEKARGKGAKETLVLTDKSALIVSVKNNTVVTVMDNQALKENVFTNIDSTVMI
ncbi:MAG: hypothetical protein KDD34_04710 [Bdellovibrionales bacterium]|nr:hypothetical protein [Bdellovibrionales bacterium]